MPSPMPTRASPRTPRRATEVANGNETGRSNQSPAAPNSQASSANNMNKTPKRTTPASKKKSNAQLETTPGGRQTRRSMRNDGDTSIEGDVVVPMTSEPLQPMPEMSSEMLMEPSPGTMVSGRSSPLSFGGTPSSAPASTASALARSLANTPRQPRADLPNSGTPRQFDVPSDAPQPAAAAVSSGLGGNQASAAAAGGGILIWGTNVVISEAKEKFKTFINTFSLASEDIANDERMEGMDLEEPYYMQKLNEIEITGLPYMNLNCRHLKDHDGNLYQQLVAYPQEVIPVLDMAVNEVFTERYANTVLQHQIEIRPYNADKTSNMRYLNPEDIDCMITINGMVIRSSNLVPDMREAYFECTVCSNSKVVAVEQGRIIEPSLCNNCQTNHAFTLIHNRSTFSDLQVIKLQESPDDMPPGQTPHSVTVQAHGTLVDTVQPGDRMTVTGIYRAVPMRAVPQQRIIKSVYRTHIDALHFRKSQNKLMADSATPTDATATEEDSITKTIDFTEERIAEITALSKKKFLYDLLAKSLAPSIYENDDIKKGILLQLFGGTKKDFRKSGRGHFRSDVNVLLCGDPGTSKSQLLQFVHNLVPRGQYTSGKGSSAVGLTAYVTKDPDTRQLVLQSGALVLSDNGICCIDEFDKMSDSTRAVLHEVMEQQTLSIARAGIICQLNARAAILAAANPVMSHWDKNKTIVENIQLPHTLLSRFDLIFLMLDEQNERFDYHLGKHLVSLFYAERDQVPQDVLEMSLLKDYIVYARTHIQPNLNEEAGIALVEEYMNMRRVGSGRGQISAYPRQLESLIRLSEAHARMRLAHTATKTDVKEAIRLYKEALKQSVTDPVSGKIDVSILTTGLSSAARRRRLEVRDAIRQKMQSYGRKPYIDIQKLYEDLLAQSDAHIARDLFDDGLQMLVDEDYGVISNKVFRPLKIAAEK